MFNCVQNCDDYDNLLDQLVIIIFSSQLSPISSHSTYFSLPHPLSSFLLFFYKVAIDGSQPTNGEQVSNKIIILKYQILAVFLHIIVFSTQARIRHQMKRHGTEVDKWPVSLSLTSQTTTPIKRKIQEDTPHSPVPPSPPSVHVSWTIESLKKPFRSDDPSASPSQSVTGSTYSEGSFDNPLFSDSPIPAIRTSHSLKDSSLLLSRDEPDGRSDISVDPSDTLLYVSAPSPLILPTPPCTPLSTGGEESQVTYSNVTPLMISAALEALSTSLSSTPNEDSQLPSILTQALNDFISGNSSKCATPPSTPQDQDEYMGHSISAGDLISAITSTLSAHCELNRSSENLQSLSGGVPSVPFGTPREGGLSELSRLGIQPELLLGALNKLRSNKDDEFVEVQEAYSMRERESDGGRKEMVTQEAVEENSNLTRSTDTVQEKEEDDDLVKKKDVFADSMSEHLPDMIHDVAEEMVEPVKREIDDHNNFIVEDETKNGVSERVTVEVINNDVIDNLPTDGTREEVLEEKKGDVVDETVLLHDDLKCDSNASQTVKEDDSDEYSKGKNEPTEPIITNDSNLYNVSSGDSLPQLDNESTLSDRDDNKESVIPATRGPQFVPCDTITSDSDCSHSDNESDIGASAAGQSVSPGSVRTPNKSYKIIDITVPNF